MTPVTSRRLTAAVTRGRAAATARMLDTFEMRHVTGTHYDPGVQGEVEDYDVLFTTRGRVRLRGSLGEVATEVGARIAVEIVRELSIPWDSPIVPAGTLAVCVAVHPSSDPTLYGARLRVDGPAPSSQTTARRLRVSEVLT